tara:strand:- start:240 stop:425 length:186 start_codon:yes stop_codon:yes gene_type:complete
MEIFEVLGAIGFISIVLVLLWGAILTVRDKQAEWQDREEYNAMKKSIKRGKRNDTARNRRL